MQPTHAPTQAVLWSHPPTFSLAPSPQPTLTCLDYVVVLSDSFGDHCFVHSFITFLELKNKTVQGDGWNGATMTLFGCASETYDSITLTMTSGSTQSQTICWPSATSCVQVDQYF